MTVDWEEAGSPEEPGRYEDGMLKIEERQLAIWREHPSARFTIVRFSSLADGVRYALGSHEL